MICGFGRAVEIETGKSNIRENLSKVAGAGFDRVVLIATSPAATAVRQQVVDEAKGAAPAVELPSWLDIS